jgi:predicted nucleotidyltransferase component of viral defense system
MAREIKNIAASVKQKLRNVSAKTGKDFQFVFRQFIQERFLYRLSKSLYADNLILKGALLFVAHDMSRYRPTRDIDFLGSSISNDKDDIKKVVQQILEIDTDDGLTFEDGSGEVVVDVEDIDEEGNYKGVRVKFNAYLENSRERVQLDVGFGDKIVGGPIEIDFPTLLDFPAPKIKVYSIESAISEKFEAILSLLLQTSRMKDFYDILFFAKNYEFKKDKLKAAIETTFKHRGTNVEQRNKVFNEKFGKDEHLQKYWTAFLTRTRLTAENSFAEVITKIYSFIEPVFDSETKHNWNSNDWKWE